MRLIDADALLEKFNRKVADMWTALTDEVMADDFAFYCKLADAVEEMPTIDRWISVKEKLPKPPAQCLVYSDKAYRPSGMETATYTNLGWMTAMYFPEVTHWMPLPEPPKEESND